MIGIDVVNLQPRGNEEYLSYHAMCKYLVKTINLLAVLMRISANMGFIHMLISANIIAVRTNFLKLNRTTIQLVQQRSSFHKVYF